MPLKYHLVLRPDLSKNAVIGKKLVHGQVRSIRTIELDHVCDLISDSSTASRGDVKNILSGLTQIMIRHMGFGDVFRFGELGSFRMIAGCKGAQSVEEFNTSLFKKGRVIFTPGPMLKRVAANVKFERCEFAKKQTRNKKEGKGD